ncbi:MAG TPA: hypothetical protein VFM88_18675 [Vicinamibacteria bacterium]|nr:hypothetical protein [Vicinamibacteria bacterium]
MAARRGAAARAREELEADRVWRAYDRLARARAFYTLVRGALPLPTLKRLLRHAMPRGSAREMPNEVWASLAASIALEDGQFGAVLAQALHEQLAWDREPPDMDEWWRAVRERPLEALWMAALSESKVVRKEFVHVAAHCLENWRQSPACTPPSWDYVEALLDVQAESARDVREAERRAEDAERKQTADRDRLEELREELKRLRRENAELRGGKADAERRAARASEPGSVVAPDAARLAELERRLRKAEKENEHLRRENERLETARGATPGAPEAPAAEPPDEQALAAFELTGGPDLSMASDTNPRRRVLRQMLRKLVKKGKIGAAHTHEDNVYRGVADHEKGIAKEAIDLLYREGFFVPKPTATDPHVSIAPERMPEVRGIIAGQIDNARLLRFLEG